MKTSHSLAGFWTDLNSLSMFVCSDDDPMTLSPLLTDEEEGEVLSDEEAAQSVRLGCKCSLSEQSDENHVKLRELFIKRRFLKRKLTKYVRNLRRDDLTDDINAFIR
ncbi:hypothetical protein ACOME3_009667 [Neoechinorhynchus agilis]